MIVLHFKLVQAEVGYLKILKYPNHHQHEIAPLRHPHYLGSADDVDVIT